MRYFFWWLPNKIKSILYLKFQYPQDTKIHAQQKAAIEHALDEYKYDLHCFLVDMGDGLDMNNEYERGRKDTLDEIRRFVNWKGS